MRRKPLGLTVGFVPVCALAALGAIADDKTRSAAAVDSTTEGTVNAGGQVIAYRAVAGTLTVGSSDTQDALLGPDGKTPDEAGATARMFYAAYFKKDGGHMGAFGPRRVLLPDAQPDAGAPYRIVNSHYTLLDASDVVFVDAPGTGFGQIAGPNTISSVDLNKVRLRRIQNQSLIKSFGRATPVFKMPSTHESIKVPPLTLRPATRRRCRP